MSESPVSAEENRSPRKIILAALVVSRFATQPPAILTGLLLIDIGLTFGSSVGVTGQIRTASAMASVIFALLMGALSVRFNHKSLLMMGLLFLSISALGSGLASNFSMMLVLYSITGLGIAMATPMGLTLVGEHFSLEKRPSAIGWIMTGAAVSYLICAPAIGLIADFGGWRLAFLGFVLPICVLAFLLAAKGLPVTSEGSHSVISLGSYFEGFKRVFSNRSADACLVGTALSWSAWQAILLYSSSFYRQRFLVSTGFASVLLMGAAVCFTVGNLVSGRLTKRFGRKPFTVLSALFTGIFVISYTNVSNLWLSVVLSFLGSLFSGMRFTASNSLTLEQSPGYRGTMMSISTAADQAGAALGAAVGGLLLLLLNYEGMAADLNRDWACLAGCLNGNVIAALCRLGKAGDPRVRKAVEHLLSFQEPDGGWGCRSFGYHKRDKHSCFMGAICALEGLVEYTEHRGTKSVHRAVKNACEFLLMHRLYKADHHRWTIIKDDFTKRSAPWMVSYNILRALKVITRAGVADERMTDALHLLLAKRNSKGRWIREAPWPSATYSSFGSIGVEDKWVTLNALLILKRDNSRI